MKFTQRLGYYLGGFSIGLVILAFFLNGKDASCDYGPNARTTKNIASKPLEYSEGVMELFSERNIDSTTARQLIRYGSVDFSNSDTKSQPCKTYRIENAYKEVPLVMSVKNCDSLATILSVVFEK